MQWVLHTFIYIFWDSYGYNYRNTENEVLNGTIDIDNISGLGGDDTLYGFDGDDILDAATALIH